MSVEIWKDIPKHPGYQVSTHGRVRSFRVESVEKILKEYIDRHGYSYLKLGSGPHYKVHKIVLDTFVRERLSTEVCRHLDGNPANNHLVNLCWGSVFENYDDRRRHGTAINGSRNPKASLIEEDVKDIRDSSESTLDLAEMYAVAPVTIWRIKTGRSWTHVQ